MAVFRIHKENNYTCVDNNIFKNKKLSFKAKGLLCTMLSLPESWDFSEMGLTTLSTDNRTSVRTAMKELEEEKYLVRNRIRNEKGQLQEVKYDVYERPMFENPTLENPMFENPTLENDLQLNTNKLSTEEINNTTNNNETIFDYIEINFGRTLSPIEYEQIKEWEDNDLTRYAIKKAVLNQKYNIKYIDKILYEWKKNNITSVQQAQANDEEFKNRATNKFYKPKETKIPEWYGKEQEIENMSNAEQEEIDNILNELII